MKETIPFYLDVYSFDNFLIQYFILWAVAKITKDKIPVWRLSVGSVIGTIYSILYVFIEYMPKSYILYSAAARIIVSMLILAITYNIANIRKFFKVFVVFYCVNFVVAGGAFSLFYFTKTGVYNHGIFYIQYFPVRILLISIFISYVVLKISWTLVAKHVKAERCIVPIHIVYEGQKIGINALVDTGNHLVDPITKTPVIVVEFKAIKNILPDEVKLVFYENKEDDFIHLMEKIESNEFAKRIRMIPFSSLGRKNGMLFGFRPDKIQLILDKGFEEMENVIIGISKHKLSKDDHYEALLHPDIVQL